MNVMRSHPSSNRGKARILRKAHTDLNAFQTVRAGTRNLKKLPPTSSTSGVGGTTLCRWAVSEENNSINVDGASVSNILSSAAVGNCWLPQAETGKNNYSVTNLEKDLEDPATRAVRENLLHDANCLGQEQPEGFFDSIFNNPIWNSTGHDAIEQRNEEEYCLNDPFSSSNQLTTNFSHDGEFFPMEQSLLGEFPEFEIPNDVEKPNEAESLPMRNSRNQEQPKSVFKTPMLLSEDDSSSRLEKDYDSILNTPISVNELPRLSTPLFSSKLGSDSPQSLSKQSTSRCKTSRVKTTIEHSSAADPAVIVALTEGRGYAVCEVGLAFININQPILTLSQISDFQTYSKTLSKINVFNPIELVVPDTFVSDKNTSDLYKRVTEYFCSIKVVSVKRLCFNAEQGLDNVRTLCLPEYSSVDIIAHRKYYALAAAAALLKYIEHEHNTVYAKQSIQVRYENAMGVVALDVATSKRLELVKTNGEMVDPEKYSLMGVMCSTVTLGGRRRLRSEILQPLASRDIIEERLDIVSYLLANSSFLVSLQGAVAKFSNAEKLMWLCKQIPDFKREKKSNETMTNYILLLKTSLENLPLLREILSENENNFLINAREILSDQRFQKMLDLITQKIHNDAKPSKGYQGAEINRCFSIKDGVNGLLDVARSTYSKLVQEIQDLITKLADENDIPLKMGQSVELGFHGQYNLPKNSEIINAQIPSVFTDVKIKGNICHVSTDEMFSLNVRIRRAVQEIQLISNVILFELIKDLRPLVGCLYNLCEYIALLDLVCSLAKYSSTPNFVRPIFGDHLNIIGGRHPILDHLDPVKPTPNDVFASNSKNVKIITGPNMSGKTVYLLQVALLQIIAQIGSYVPAESAEFRITDHIYVRKDGPERVESNVSGFAVEVKEIMYCLSTMTDTSLVILDELCTGTNNEGGTAVAWAICEQVLCRPVFTFIATHIQFLTQLENIFINVSNYHMEAIESSQTSLAYGPITFTYRLLKGVTQISHYGLRLMMNTMLPEEVKNEAQRIVEKLTKRRANCLALAKKIPANVQTMMSRVDKLEKFMHNLYQLSQSEQYSLESVQTLQRSAVDTIIIDEMKAKILNEPGTPPSSRSKLSFSYSSVPFENAENQNAVSIDVSSPSPVQFPNNQSLLEYENENQWEEHVNIRVNRKSRTDIIDQNLLDSDDYSDDDNDSDDHDPMNEENRSTKSISRNSVNSTSSMTLRGLSNIATSVRWEELSSNSSSTRNVFTSN